MKKKITITFSDDEPAAVDLRDRTSGNGRAARERPAFEVGRRRRRLAC